MNDKSKQCNECQQVKPVDEFPKAGIQKGIQYYRSVCKQCALSERTRNKNNLLVQGLIECSACNRVLSVAEFYDDPRKQSGKRTQCKQCASASTLAYRKTESGRESYRQIRRKYNAGNGKIAHSRYVRRVRAEGRWYEQERARKAVQDAIRRKGFPKACTQSCNDCNAQAEEYHHESYERSKWLDVTPLCIACHRNRHQTTKQVQS